MAFRDDVSVGRRMGGVHIFLGRLRRGEGGGGGRGAVQFAPDGSYSGIAWVASLAAASLETPSLCQPPTLRSPCGIDIARMGGVCRGLSLAGCKKVR